MENPLDEPLRRVLGTREANRLQKAFGYTAVGELLGHFPRRYYGTGEVTDFSKLEVGEEVTLIATITKVDTFRMRAKKGTVTKVTVSDSRQTIDLTYFNYRNPGARIPLGRKGLFAGQVSEYRGKLQLTHPNMVLLADDLAESPSLDEDLEVFEGFVGRMIPVYPATANVSSWAIARWVDTILRTLPELADPIPLEIRARDGLADLRDAYRHVHFPKDRAEIQRGLARFRYQEALVLQTVLAKRRQAVRGLTAVPRLEIEDGLRAAFDHRLPFTLTQGQQEVARQLREDLAKEHPMHRLLQGEVGSGKTVVALRAMLTVVDTGGQAALLAPTEVLAQQHARSIRTLLGPLAEAGMLGGADQGTQVALLTGSLSASARRKTLLDIASGTAGIVIGTHALLQETVDFFDLGLVVIDEQHRFGVEQRDALRAKGRQPPHVLVMTATPIPRTVAMTVFGDLETSSLTELPAGRLAITSHVVPTDGRPRYLERCWERVREEVDAGHQAYIVCPRIGEGSADEDIAQDAQSVLELTPRLTAGPLSGLRVEALHGRMPADAKEETMRRFSEGEIDVLVATTVIEVGVDVPAATLMVVMEAERFGVSQLHQLRGRVGRGANAGLCLFVTAAPEQSPALDRLEAVAATLDGFALSRLDLEQRREGDVLGSSQSGFRSGLQTLRVLRDEDIIVQARKDATNLVEFDPELESLAPLQRAVWEVLADDRVEYLEKT